MKIGLIISHEYTTRVMKKSFIVLTFLMPLLSVALIAVPTWLAMLDSNTTKTIVIIDNSNLYGDVFTDNKEYHFVLATDELQVARQQHTNVTGFLYISDNLINDNAQLIFYSEKQPGMSTISYLENKINSRVEEQKLAATGIDGLKELIQSTKSNLSVKTVKWSDKSEQVQASSVGFAEIIGMIAGLLIYMFIIMYGAQVMSGVVQEKSNRIMEVMLSSVKPFELMMGKIVGIALVGLTQFALWVVLIAAGVSVVMPLLGVSMPTSTTDAQELIVATQDAGLSAQIIQSLLSFDWVEMILLFIFYFIGGYLLYASFFAALGSAVDNETDTQQFSLPITLPVIFALYAGMFSAQNPEGPFAFWCSIIPFTSPVVMLVRLPFDVAWWELALSMAILVLSFIGSTWMAGKIYRTGVFMYGKKPTFKEIVRWLRY